MSSVEYISYIVYLVYEQDRSLVKVNGAHTARARTLLRLRRLGSTIFATHGRHDQQWPALTWLHSQAMLGHSRIQMVLRHTHPTEALNQNGRCRAAEERGGIGLVPPERGRAARCCRCIVAALNGQLILTGR